MTLEEIEQRFNELEQEVNEAAQEVERDAHLDFIESLRQYVNKY